MPELLRFDEVDTVLRLVRAALGLVKLKHCIVIIPYLGRYDSLSTAMGSRPRPTRLMC